MRQALVHGYYAAAILYYFLSISTSLNEKNSELKSCISRQELQFSYKNILHPKSYQRIMIF
jgi:hypothetical protein